MNGISEPLVSIILPVYNASKHLPSCLESILKQKHNRIEVIAIDDHSRDASAKILRQYQKQDRRIKVYRNVKRYGLAISLNRALKQAQGEFITFMNPHDVNSVWRIKKQIDFLKQHPRVVAVGTQAVTIDEAGKQVDRSNLPVHHEHIYSTFIKGIAMQLETIMINRMLIPKDLLHFAQNRYPFVYIEPFIKLFQYGQFANLMQHLYYHRGRPIGPKVVGRKNFLFKQIEIVIKSITEYAYRPSVKDFLPQFIRPTIG